MPECMWGIPEHGNNDNLNDSNAAKSQCVTLLDAQDLLLVMSRCMHE